MLLHRLAKTIQINKTFFIAYSLLLLLGIYPLLAHDKISLFLMINRHHHPFWDQFFYYFTHLGNGVTYCGLILIVWLWQKSYRLLFLGMGSFVIMSGIVQFLKRIVFADQLRPIKLVQWTNEIGPLHVVDQTTVLTHLSFPSGHAATIFTAACFLSLISSWRRRLAYNIVLLIVSLGVAYSRIYLCQHFYTDVYGGAVIGGWSTLLVYAWLADRPMPTWLAHKLPDLPWKKHL